MNTFSLEQLSKTGCLVANLILRQYNLDLLLRIIHIKSDNPKLTEKQTANELGCSDSTLELYGNDLKLKCSYKSSNEGSKRTQMTSKELVI